MKGRQGTHDRSGWGGYIIKITSTAIHITSLCKRDDQHGQVFHSHDMPFHKSYENLGMAVKSGNILRPIFSLLVGQLNKALQMSDIVSGKTHKACLNLTITGG